MPRQNKTDPYSGFTDDHERRRALNTRVRAYSLAAMVMTLAGTPVAWMEKIQWVLHFLR